MLQRALIVLSVLVVSHALRAEVVPLTPSGVLSGDPQRTAVTISPDGARIAYLAPHGGALNVWVENLDGRQARAVTASIDRPIQLYEWAANSQQILYLRDRNGAGDHQVVAVDLETGAERGLTPERGIQARLLMVDRDHPDEVLVAINDRDPQVHDVYRVNTRTGERELVFRNDVLGNDTGFANVIADTSFRVRVGTAVTASGDMQAYVLDDETGAWVELAKWESDGSLTGALHGFSRDGDTLYFADSNGRDTGGLFSLSVGVDDAAGPDGAESRWSLERVAADDRGDLGPIVFDPATGQPQAVSRNASRRSWTIIDESIRADWEALQVAAEGEPSIESRDDDDRFWIVSFTRDDGLVEYHLYVRDRRRCEYMFATRTDP
ncbi:MAG: TolB family protein [Planctomycetota bacterium]|jgi:hypothetical protein